MQSSQQNEQSKNTVEIDTGPITLKGGIGDPIDFIKAEGKKDGYKYAQANLYTPLFRMECRQFNSICSEATVYFHDGVETHLEAFEHLKEHLPIDMEVSEHISKKDGAVVVYNLNSKLLYKGLKPLYEREGITPRKFYVSFRINSDKDVFAAVINIGEEDLHND